MLDSPYLNQTEAAEFLRVVPRTLIRWEEEGRLKPFRPTKTKNRGGGIVLYRLQDLINFIEGGAAAKPTAAPKRGRPKKVEPQQQPTT
ncbi:helix-turn-helix domain-containing protein [Elstera sp.]|uniref:helix-turn-helix domain-containing protein n=1 Tax=Elstera sp. TaxID=1916664 RepID=UPI0037C12930